MARRRTAPAPARPASRRTSSSRFRSRRSSGCSIRRSLPSSVSLVGIGGVARLKAGEEVAEEGAGGAARAAGVALPLGLLDQSGQRVVGPAGEGGGRGGAFGDEAGAPGFGELEEAGLGA